MNYIPLIKLSAVLVLTSSANAAINLSITSTNVTAGNVVDKYDAVGPQLATDYLGSWSDSETGANGDWIFSVTDESENFSLTFLRDISVENLPSLSSGQGIQFILDGSTGTSANDQKIKFSFSYSVNSLGSATSFDYGAAFATGPHGSGNFDNEGGVLTAGGVLVDNTPTGGVVASYDPLTGDFSTTPNDGRSSASPNHDYTIVFAGTQTITFDGAIDDTDTYVFGIGSPVPASVPEPSSTILLGLAGLAFISRRKRG